MPPIIKEPWELDLMRQAGRIVAEALALLRERVRPGVSTAELDALFEKHARENGGTCTFKGYRGFPASICTSVNEEVVHGIPSLRRLLKEGDIVAIDGGVTYRGYVGDAAITVGVGGISAKAQRLLDVTQEALERAIAAVGPGERLSRVSAAVQQCAEEAGYSVVKKFVGHGLGRQLHEEPQVPNYVLRPVESFEFILKPGIVIAIEPMVNEGTDDVKTLSDGWTVVTKDGGLSAHFEHSVAVTAAGREVLTRL